MRFIRPWKASIRNCRIKAVDQKHSFVSQEFLCYISLCEYKIQNG